MCCNHVARFMMVLLALASVGITVVPIEQLLSGSMIADNGKCGCRHSDRCFPCPEDY